MNKADLGGGIVLIIVGLVIVLSRSVQGEMAEAGASQQRGWARLLPWLRRQPPFMTTRASWRPFVILGGVVCIVGGLLLLAGASD